MKKISTLLLVTLSIGVFAQQQTGRISKGSMGFGLHWACPQSELKDIKYDDGIGIHFTYLSKKMPYKSPINFQWGVRMDFGNLGKREFENIIVEDNGTILPGGATITAGNTMYGLFTNGRINFLPDGTKLTPYMDAIVGHRNYSTHQTLSLNKPGLNPEYESSDVVNRVVHTKRFHYGGSIGVNYQVSPAFSLESSITYTFGEIGAVLPLQDIVRSEGSNEVNYTNFQRVKTDLLLMNVGLRLHLFKNYDNINAQRPKTTNSQRENTGNRDTNATNAQSTTKRERVIPGNRNTRNTTTPKKTPQIKSDGLKRDPNARK